jgi:hypothetical protein
VRFVTDNPGTWMVHCHIDFHMESGMGFLIRVGKDSDLPPKPKNWLECQLKDMNVTPISESVSTSNSSMFTTTFTSTSTIKASVFPSKNLAKSKKMHFIFLFNLFIVEYLLLVLSL